jgi:Fe-S-cluster containining protein
MRSRDAVDDAELAPLRLELRIAGEPLRVEVELPVGPTTPKRMLPLFRQVTDEVVARAARDAVARGLTISCKAGCGACCSQIIPVSPAETRRLAELVAESPPARRDVLRARFARAKKRFEEAGLWARLEAHASLDDADVPALAEKYFALGVACPFLENQSCSVYEDRPLVCREALVTSPAANCGERASDEIDIVPIAARPSVALSRLDPLPGARKHDWVPLVLAIAFDEAHPDEPEARPAAAIASEFAARLAVGGGGVGSPPPEPPARGKARRRV